MKPPKASRRGILSIVVCTLLLVPLAVLAHRLEDEMGASRALAHAAWLYDSGDLERALVWTQRAQELLLVEIEEQEDPPPRSNASLLLEMLDLYAVHAYGQDEELDAEFEEMAELLSLLHAIESENPRPSRFAGLRVYTHADGGVYRIGEKGVYQHADDEIYRIGDFNIHSHADGEVYRMGSIQFYSHADGSLYRVGGVNVD